MLVLHHLRPRRAVAAAGRDAASGRRRRPWTGAGHGAFLETLRRADGHGPADAHGQRLASLLREIADAGLD